MSDLAEATHQSAASLTGVVDRLREKQLVDRVTNERDRRQVMVTETARGMVLISEIKQARRDQMRAALAHLSDQQIELFLQTLDQVMAGMLRVLEHGENRRLA